MNLVLTRKYFRPDGIFGVLSDENQTPLAVTLEHSYQGVPKVPPGVYTCKRGLHSLPHRTPFETFEVQNVPDHTGILFHMGNFNCDSEGCILLGHQIQINPESGLHWIDMSITTFLEFMKHQEGVDEFLLTIKNI